MVGNHASIFHSTTLHLMHKYLIVFAKLVGSSEKLLEETHAFYCCLKKKWSHFLNIGQISGGTVQRHGDALNILKITLYSYLSSIF